MLFAEIVVNHQTSDAESGEKQKKDDVAGIGAELHDAVALFDGQREHQNHND